MSSESETVNHEDEDDGETSMDEECPNCNDSMVCVYCPEKQEVTDDSGEPYLRFDEIWKCNHCWTTREISTKVREG